MQMYLRAAALTVGTLRFAGRLAFQVVDTKCGAASADCTVSAYNLNQNSRDYIEELALKGKGQVTLEAGYGQDLGVIFKGSLYYSDTERKEADILTTLHVKAGLEFNRDAHAEITGFYTDAQVWRLLAIELPSYFLSVGAVSPGILAKFAAGVYPRGFVFSGPIKKLLDHLATRHGLEWHISNGALHWYDSGEYQTPGQLLISANTGMIGYPSKAFVGGGSKETGWKVRSLLNPGITPGAQVQVESSAFKLPAQLAVVKVEHRGDTLEGDWYSEFEGFAKAALVKFLGPK